MPAPVLMFCSLREHDRSKSSNVRGFSLIELLVVMAIMSILLSMGVYSWQRFVQNNNLRSATRLVMADIAQYRERSAAESQAYTITFDVAGGTYTIVSADSIVNLTKSLAMAGPEISFQNPSFLGGTVNQISIQTRGLLNSGSISLRNGRGSTTTITVTQAGRTYASFQMQ